MEYIFSGSIRGFYYGDCFDFLSRVTVKLYPSGRQELTAAREKETFHLRGKEEMQAICKLLMANRMIQADRTLLSYTGKSNWGEHQHSKNQQLNPSMVKH